MAQNKILNKIETFVKDQIDSSKSSVIITETANGYRVNNYSIKLANDHWFVSNSSDEITYKLRSQRLAVLYSVLAIKKKFRLIAIIDNLDCQLYTLKHDKKLFESMISNDYKTELFENRLSRTLNELSGLYQQISELEKSVGLQ